MLPIESGASAALSSPFNAVGFSPSEALPEPCEPGTSLLTGPPDQCLNALMLPTVRKLADMLEHMRQQELKQHRHKKIGIAEARLLEEATQGVLARFIRLVALKFDKALHRGESEQFAEMLTEIFCLETGPARLPRD